MTDVWFAHRLRCPRMREHVGRGAQRRSRAHVILVRMRKDQARNAPALTALRRVAGIDEQQPIPTHLGDHVRAGTTDEMNRATE